MEPRSHDGRIGRRELLTRAGAFGAAVIVAPPLLRGGLLGGPLPSPQAVLPGVGGTGAVPQADVVADTFAGVAAFVVPGDDAYSQHQGVTLAEPGGVAAQTPAFLVAMLNDFLPAPPSSRPTPACRPPSRRSPGNGASASRRERSGRGVGRWSGRECGL